MALAAENSMASTSTEATLQLTVLSISLNKSKPSSSSSSHFLIASIDPYPSLKTSTQTLKTLTLTLTPLHLPLPSPALSNPSSALSLHILSPRLPFRRPKLVGAASLPLSSLRLSGDVLTLPLLKPSTSTSRPRGTIRVELRILWCLGQHSFAGVVGPSAPPAPPLTVSVEDSADLVSMDAGSGPPMLEEDESGDSKGWSVDDCVEVKGGCDDVKRIDRTVEDRKEDKGALRSFLVGLVSGTVAAVLVGAASLAEG